MLNRSVNLRAVGALAKRELVRFYRQRGRIISSLVTPLLFLLFLGTGLQAAFPGARPASGENFLQYFLVANLVMTVLFTSVFAAISLIEDRHQGFLQGVLIAPCSRLTIALGKILGASTVAVGQGLIFLLLAPLLGVHLGLAGFVGVALMLLSIALTLSALGHYFAWKFDSVQSFHSVMNLVLFPMWILSGAFFPVETTPAWLKPLMYANPLTYGVLGIKEFFFGNKDWWVAGQSGVAVLAFGVLFVALLILQMKKPTEVHARNEKIGSQ